MQMMRYHHNTEHCLISGWQTKERFPVQTVHFKCGERTDRKADFRESDKQCGNRHTWPSEKTAAVVEKEAQTTHLIINQVYRRRRKGKTPVSASFIKLYWIQPQRISDWAGYTIEYPKEAQKQLDRNGHISHPYLIKGQEEDFADLICTIEKSRSGMDLAISNKQHRIRWRKAKSRLTVSLSMKKQKELHWQIRKMIRSSPRKRRSAVSALSIRVIMQPILKYSIIVRSHLKFFVQVKPRSTADGSWGTKDIVKTENIIPLPLMRTEKRERFRKRRREKASEKK